MSERKWIKINNKITERTGRGKWRRRWNAMPQPKITKSSSVREREECLSRHSRGMMGDEGACGPVLVIQPELSSLLLWDSLFQTHNESKLTILASCYGRVP